MTVVNINPEIDVILPNKQSDIDRLSLNELMDQIKLEESLYYFERKQIRKQRRIQAQNRTFKRRVMAALI